MSKTRVSVLFCPSPCSPSQLPQSIHKVPQSIPLSSPSSPPQVLRYGSHVSLKSTDALCWLHSHPHLYPLKYPDDRGSSYQQQVTWYEFADINNLWEVRRLLGPGGVAGAGSDSHDPVRNKDLVELVHINTSKILNRYIPVYRVDCVFKEF